jgi:glycosyltransferase involved in cell wall biosynthesis
MYELEEKSVSEKEASQLINLNNPSIIEQSPLNARSILDIRVALVMPVHNEADTIQDTVLEIEQKVISKMPNASLFVFEDGSTDGTKQIIMNLSREENRIFSQMSDTRKGYPGAIKDAIMSIDESRFDYVMFLDSDGQYNPEDFMKLLEAASRQSADIVMGQRKERPESAYRVALSKGLGFLEKNLFSLSCTDVTSALRIMRVNVAKEIVAKIKYTRYSFWSEFTARASEEGYTTIEIPVAYRTRKKGGKSNIYALERMPKIVSIEFNALLRTWWEYKGIRTLRYVLFGIFAIIGIVSLLYFLANLSNQSYLPLFVALSFNASMALILIFNRRFSFGKKSSSDS